MQRPPARPRSLLAASAEAALASPSRSVRWAFSTASLSIPRGTKTRVSANIQSGRLDLIIRTFSAAFVCGSGKKFGHLNSLQNYQMCF
jgi:hypothetical protein